MLILECSQGCYGRTDGRKEGRKEGRIDGRQRYYIPSQLCWRGDNNIYTKANKTLCFLHLNLKNKHINLSFDHHLSMIVLPETPTIKAKFTFQLRASRFVFNRQQNPSNLGDMLQHLNCCSLKDMHMDANENVAATKQDRLKPSLRQSQNMYFLSSIIPSCLDSTKTRIISPL